MSRSLSAAKVTAMCLAGALAAACAASPPTAAAPIPHVYTPPFVEPTVRAWAEEYVAETGALLPFDLDPQTLEVSLDRAAAGADSLLIFGGPPPEGWFVTPMGAIPVTIVLHPDNPITDLEPSDLENLFSRRVANWAGLGGDDVAVQPVVPLPEEPVRTWFEATVMHGAPIWPGARLAPTPEAMADLVASDPGAVGIVLGAAPPAGINAVRVSGRLPSGTGYAFLFDVLAFSPREPTGGVRDWLGWVQANVEVR
jgi:ABC-type phosphate transport system substrate-binding protein